MAMQFSGHIKEWKEVKALVSTDEEYEPDQALHQRYLKNFVIYDQLYEKLKDDFRKIDTLQAKD